MKHVDGDVAVACDEGQRPMGALEQFYLGDVRLHQEVRVHFHVGILQTQVLTFVISVEKKTRLRF